MPYFNGVWKEKQQQGNNFDYLSRMMDILLYYLIMKSLLILVVCISLLYSPLNAQQTTYGYACNVANCQICSFTGFCGLCSNNYILQINSTTSVPYCQQVTCTVPNCNTCYQNNVCSACNSGFFINVNGTCTTGTAPNTCTAGCSYCNSTACLLCNFGYNLQNGACFPNNGNNVQNCLSAFSGYACQLCAPNYMVNMGYQCVNNPGFTCNSVSNCAVCTQASSQVSCSLCQTGYQTNLGACVAQNCNVQNCLVCDNNAQTCTTCMEGYKLSGTSCAQQVFPCSIQNCVYCAKANMCSQCSPGYQPVTNSQTQTGSGTTTVSSCQLITASNGAAIPVTNCQTFGPMIPGTSSLGNGCVTCQTNYVNVGGYCVANLTQGNFTCQIQNCVYCIQNNVCGQCTSGYTVYMGTTQCVKNYSPIPNCLLTPIFTTICYQCASGYALVDSEACVPIPSISCNVSGCSYCLQNNTCAACLAGYTLSTTSATCTPLCTLDNCFQCASNIQCQTCNIGYYVQNGQCVNASNQLAAYCTQNFGANCTSCSYYACNQCSTGYTVNPQTGQCCPNPNYNFANCAQYNTVWASTGCTATFTCTACNSGSFSMTPFQGSASYCVTIPCTIQNCAYCMGSNICNLCNTGFTLVNGACQTANATCSSMANCATCSSSTNCTSCQTGYVLFNGACVCNYQNCLACMGSAFCTVCAFPTIATQVSSAGCLPQIVPNIQCNVSNCLNCMASGFCAQCFNGYTLQPNGTCTVNTCNRASNCSLCSYNQTICYLCNPGYIQTNLFSGNCTQISTTYSCNVQGCALCQPSNPNQCQTCSPFYSFKNGACDPLNCAANCIFCLSPNSCFICQAGFYLSNGTGGCLPNNSTVVTCTNAIPNCVGCQTQTISGTATTVCVQCMFGLQPAQNQLSCVPQTCTVPNCNLCIQNRKFNNGLQWCLVCQQGYFINSNYQCTPYSPSTAIQTANCSGIYNCLYCGYDNYCDYCAPNWNATNGVCLTSTFCSVANCAACTTSTLCATCNTNYGLSANNQVCIPLCNITNCQTCANTTTCNKCTNNMIVNGNACGCSDSTFNIVNGTCVCPNGTSLLSGTCISCNVTNCAQCSASNVCSLCLGNLTVFLNNNTCGCNDGTFTQIGTNCTCPANTTLSGTGTTSTCMACNVANCALCNTANVCTNCLGNLTVFTGNNTCGCNDNTFTQNGTSCLCPVNTTLSGTGTTSTCMACNVANCALCNTANVCANCVLTFSLNTTSNTCTCSTQQTQVNGTCVACTNQYCASCNATNYCVQCNTGFTAVLGSCVCPSNFTLYNDACINCSINNCILCQTTNVCQNCASGYIMNTVTTGTTTSTLCIQCNVANCNSCSSPNYCTSCANNLVVNSQGNQCVSCSLSNCALCLNSYTCVSCNPGYQLSSTSTSYVTTCIQCNIQGCGLCASSTTCQQCLTGYSLTSTGSCSLCVPPCATCNGNSATQCVTCLPPFSSTPASNGTCYTCNVANCLTCSVTNTYTCTACMNNYALTSNNACTYNGTCSINCANCLLNQYCLTCNPGYTINLTNNAQCVLCKAGYCQTCSPSDLSTCVVCLPGFYLQNGICYACPYINCLTCTNTTCLTYQNSANQFAISVNNVTQAASCDPGCATCSSIYPAACITCSPGYSLNSNRVCVPCTYPCLTCASNAPSTCLSCYGSFTVSGNTCVACAGNCLTCSSTNTSQCTSCPLGFNLNNGGCSSGCPQYCSACSSSNFCTYCMTGFSANPQGQCLPCTSNCRVCSGTAQGVCLQCGNGFYLSSGSCIACSSNCQTCNSQGCLTCNTGYTLNGNITCTINCNAPCATCQSSNPNSCTSCLFGYTLNGNSCTATTTCSGGVCQTCPIGYINSITSCTPCNSGSNCARCSATNTSACITCMSGYYLNGSICSQCPSNCLTCISSSSCQTCSAGYTTVIQLVNAPSTCVKCTTPCSQCSGSATSCTACIGGFTLVGWSCLSTFNYGFFVSLNTTMAVFYDNYAAFLQALVAPINSKNIQAVTVQSILPGSVNVTGNITTLQESNSNGASSQFYALQNSLDTGTIANMPIITSYVNVNGGSVPAPSSGPNLALILGICIPVGIIIIGLLIYFIFIRKSNKDSQPVQYKSNNTTVRETFELTAKGQPTL